MYREPFSIHRSIRESKLIDSLESVEQRKYDGLVWRSVKEHRDPTTCFSSQGRWDDGSFEVLYTSEAKNTAIQERLYHINFGQPLIPSKVQFRLYSLHVRLEHVLDLSDFQYLATLGLDPSHFGQLSYLYRTKEYGRSQDVAEGCAFLGADGILVPSARVDTERNLVVFCRDRSEQLIRVHSDEGILAISDK